MANNSRGVGLDVLAVFKAVADYGGFRAAAKMLSMSPSSVSEQIAALERELGAPLFVRTTRSMKVTEAGLDLAARIGPLLREARAALDDASSSQQTVRGLLKLNVTGAVMTDILPPLLDQYVEANPLVRVEIVVEDRLVDAIAAGCDAGIRYGEHLAQDMVAIPLGPRLQRFALGASPGYLEKAGIPDHPNQLLRHHCIRLKFSSGSLVAWTFEHGSQILSLDPPGRFIIGVDAAPAAIELAERGRGIIGTFENWLDPSFRSGRLVPVLPQWWSSFEGPWLYYSSRFTSAPLRAFIDIVNVARASQSA